MSEGLVRREQLLRADGERFGLSPSEIADALEQWGHDTLNLIIEGLRYGLSKEFLLKVLEFAGPILLDVVVNVAKARFFGAPKYQISGAKSRVLKGDDLAERLSGSIIEGELVDSFDAQSALVDKLIEKFLPLIIEKYGEQLLQIIVEAILKLVSGR